MTIVAAYPPPLGLHAAAEDEKKTGNKLANGITAIAAAEWAQEEMWTAPCRTLALLIGDLNCRFALAHE